MNQGMTFTSTPMDPTPYLCGAYFFVSVLIVGFFICNLWQRKKIQRILKEIQEYKTSC